MLSIYQLKSKFQQLLRPVAKALSKLGFTPNQVTIAAVLLSANLGLLLLFHRITLTFLLLIPIGLFIRMALNALNGIMAKEHNMQSQLGQILNELGDIISDLCLIIPLIFVTNLHPAIILSFAFLTVINEFAGLLGQAIGGDRRYDSDRTLLIGAFCILFYYIPTVILYANWIFTVACLLLILSTIIRIKKSVKT
ncbi:MAG: CDP-diacylglycerol--glycerol-3-phosphate 3-phosphatidyltransferase [Paraglaciecola sp.]|jgi:CDP-diacylglycerol--glycerol-3-phosphate 3-phosphatidyltransferase